MQERQAFCHCSHFTASHMHPAVFLWVLQLSHFRMEVSALVSIALGVQVWMGEGKTGSPDYWRTAPSASYPLPVPPAPLVALCELFQAARPRTDLAFLSIWICASQEPQEARRGGEHYKNSFRVDSR